MTADELRCAARDLVERTTTDQGLPFTVEDPSALDVIASAIRANNDDDPSLREKDGSCQSKGEWLTRHRSQRGDKGPLSDGAVA